LYARFVRAELCNASTVELAELAKLVENCQRDVNIAFVNEVGRRHHRRSGHGDVTS
jgi:UDP-N-acetyl-D-galactosamine dehydrogenase